MCPYCNFTDPSAACVEAHVNTQHVKEDESTAVCPLCQEKFHQRPTLESHLVQKHNVTQEGMQRLMLIVDQTPASPATVAKTTALSSSSATGNMSDAEKQESVENEVLKLAEEGKKVILVGWWTQEYFKDIIFRYPYFYSSAPQCTVST